MGTTSMKVPALMVHTRTLAKGLKEIKSLLTVIACFAMRRTWVKLSAFSMQRAHG